MEDGRGLQLSNRLLASKWFQLLSAGFEWDGFDYAPSVGESRS